MIELIGISGGYHGKEFVKDISAGLQRGTITSILGLNGHGKSTLVKLACGQLAPYQGDILVDGTSMRDIPAKMLAQKISYLPQSRNTPNILVETLVMHGRFPHLGYPRIYREADRQAAAKAMETVGILPLRRAYLSEISGGERQKAYMAMVLAQDTDAIFLDEPTTFLDIAYQLEMIQWIKSLRNQDKAVILVSHDINLALIESDQVLLLQSGRLVQAAPPTALLASGFLEQIFGVQISACQGPGGQMQYMFTQPSKDTASYLDDETTI